MGSDSDLRSDSRHDHSEHSSSTLTSNSDLLPLNFAGLEPVGRSEETKNLLEAFDRVRLPQAPSEIVLISGESGSGKSVVAKKLGKSVKDSEGFFVSGKYE